MARTSALGHWLKSSKGKGKQRVASGGVHAAGKGDSQETGVMGVKSMKRGGQIWMVRGGIWVGALGLSVGVDLAGKPFAVKIPGFKIHNTFVGSIFDWRIPIDSIWICKLIPSFMTASCFVVLTWNPWENYVKKANIQGRGIKIKGETAYTVSRGSVTFTLFLTIQPIDLANYRMVFTDINLLRSLSRRHGPVEGLPWPSSWRTLFRTYSWVVNFTPLFFCFYNT